MTNANKKTVEASFMQFINGFAIQILVHLGKMSNPMTNATSVDLPNAKYSIDILGVLQEKTKGNLTSEEEEYLSILLRDMRMEYVAVADAQAREKREGEGKKSEQEKDDGAE